jgi:glycogen debranching enzyme
VRFGFFFLGVRKDRTDNTKKKERKKQQERERERTREKKREKELERTRESFNQKHLNHKSTTFCSREKKTQKTLSLNTSNGEPRSGGNLERVTREKRERGAFLIVCSCVFSLFFLSKRSARKVRERFYSFPK